MPRRLETSGQEHRQRRAHTKSRRGCRNCKLRRIKCDEFQPQCRKCLSFGVVCNYNLPHNSDLQPRWQDAQSKNDKTQLNQLVFDSTPLISEPVPVVIVGRGSESFILHSDDVARLNRFQTHTVFTFACGSPWIQKIYQADVLKLAVQHPFLMHIILAITATHDRHLPNLPGVDDAAMTEAYHGAKGAALLAKKLSSPIVYEERDALWSSAAMLGIAAMTSFEASSPDEAWPLKPDGPSDLDWLNMTVGKEAIWRVTNPMRPDSIFYAMAEGYIALMTTPPLLELQEIPVDFIELCELDGPTPSDQNPYYPPVSFLSVLLQETYTHNSMPRYISFLGLVGHEFRSLLRIKDPRALLIFAQWYASLLGSQWWVAKRAHLECQAICIYLERYHSGNRRIQAMLSRPKKLCGLMD